MGNIRIKEVKERIITDNDTVALRTRDDLTKKKVFFVNLMSSPGAGKTTLLAGTIKRLSGTYRIGVLEADVDSDVDARAVYEAGARVIQLHTGGSCHMDADMAVRGLETLDVSDLDLVFLENVGNLVCPAEFDTGAHKKVMILSVPEGDDKPLKYPLMFSVSDLLIINKTDTLPVFDFSFDALSENLNKVNPGLPMISLSALDGSGFDKWIDYLETEIAAFKGSTGEQ